MNKTIAVMMFAALVGGCATKRYGRLAPVSSAESTDYTCREIAIEISKVDAFEAQIKDGADFDAKSALGILGDFGIGNSMERSSAEKSAAQRRQQLREIGARKGC